MGGFWICPAPLCVWFALERLAAAFALFHLFVLFGLYCAAIGCLEFDDGPEYGIEKRGQARQGDGEREISYRASSGALQVGAS
jgi:hypothetical protein